MRQRQLETWQATGPTSTGWLTGRCVLACCVLACYVLAGSLWGLLPSGGVVRADDHAPTTPQERSFRNEVLPLLTKQGCNSGACHGALAGKGGFRLSLRGYNPAQDHFNIVQQDRGRRVEFGDPGRSLLLTKPSGGLAHKGGVKFAIDSVEYRILADWISTGAKDTDLASVTGIEITPDTTLLSPGHEQQMQVTAQFSDARRVDVTPWVVWSSSNEACCTVNDDGAVKVVGPGEGAIVAWYSSQLAIARITVPYPAVEQSASHPIESPAPRGFIDELIDQQLRRLNLQASPTCSDETFVRRVYLDVIGLPPTADEARRFLSDRRAERRDLLIDELLQREEFVDYWTYQWSDVFMLNGQLLRPMAIQAYYQWLRGHVERNTPWDVLVRETLTATGNTHENGATNFYALFQTPEEMTENACQAFLGLSIGCAKCHNHPLEKWTNDQYYGMANLFARVRAKGWGGESRNGDGLRTIYVSDTGDLVQPRTGRPQPPRPLDEEPLAMDDPADRRVALAAWMTSPENPYFARSMTNRVWARLLGTGLVENVDDMRVSNPASNEELLSAAAGFLVTQKFDVKALMREILRSNAYQRDSQPVPGSEADTRFYSHYYPRRLMAEVLHDAIAQATDVPTQFEFVAFSGADRQKTDFYPLGTRAIELYDSAVENYFLQAFGRNARRIVCECERTDEPSTIQMLHIANGNTINDKLSRETGRVAQLLSLRRAGASVDGLLDELFLVCLSRFPNAAERAAFVEALPAAGAEGEQEAWEDLCWALLSSREFLFNH